MKLSPWADAVIDLGPVFLPMSVAELFALVILM